MSKVDYTNLISPWKQEELNQKALRIIEALDREIPDLEYQNNGWRAQGLDVHKRFWIVFTNYCSTLTGTQHMWNGYVHQKLVEHYLTKE